MEETVFFSTTEVLKLLKITRQELYTVMRPVRSKGAVLPPLYRPECFANKLAGVNWIFTQRDIIKLGKYFKALKEYKLAREELTKGRSPTL